MRRKLGRVQWSENIPSCAVNHRGKNDAVTGYMIGEMSPPNVRGATAETRRSDRPTPWRKEKQHDASA